jgi:hypothetical protein
VKISLSPSGEVRFIYSDKLRGLVELGQSKIERASHVEPTNDNCWIADLSPVNGPKLGPFKLRADALKAEVEWLETHHV